MQKVVGWTLVVIGLVATVLGAVVMTVLGPDNRLGTGRHELDTDGVAVVTAPGLIRWTGVQVDVLVRVPVNKPVFVGVGHSADVQDYLGETERLEITEFSAPWQIATRQLQGQPSLDAAPTALDWWLASQAGLGGAGISYELPDDAVSLAVLAVGSADLSGLEVELAYGVKGGFGRGLGLSLIGIGVAWFGWSVRADGLWRPVARLQPVQSPPLVEDDHIVVEEEVFVWVDDDGIEHELTAEQLASFEDYEVIEEDADTAGPDGSGPESVGPESVGPESVGTAADSPPTIAQKLAERPDAPPTAGQIVAESEAANADKHDGPAASSVMYVWVDDEGVEHEVSPDDLEAYQIVDEEDDRS